MNRAVRTEMPPGAVPLLAVRGLAKRFGHVEALRGADLDIDAGEIVGLVGDNGAGKSTITKILSGNFTADSGDVLLNGKRVKFTSPLSARNHGIETVYQDLALAPDLDAVANLFLGRELYRSKFLGLLDDRKMRQRAQTLFHELGVKIPSSHAPVFRLSGGQRQGIAVARAVAWSARLIIMDEPTAALGVDQSDRVLGLIRQMRTRGIAVLLISHNIAEVCAIADRIQVYRFGQRVAVLPRGARVPDVLSAVAGLSRPSDAPPQ